MPARTFAREPAASQARMLGQAEQLLNPSRQLATVMADWHRRTEAKGILTASNNVGSLVVNRLLVLVSD